MPKKTVVDIVEQGNHYVIEVKGNQPTLHQAMQNAFATCVGSEVYSHTEKTRGQTIMRTTTVMPAQPFSQIHEWKNLKTYVCVNRIRTTKKGISNENAYFISDATFSSEIFHQGVQQHWHIENKLHWVKDVLHQEDTNNITCGNGPLMASIFSTIAINLHRKVGFQSISDAQVFAQANIKNALFKILRT